MDAQDIITLVTDAGAEDATAMLAALEDGAALAALGIGDGDQEAVEEAHDTVRRYIKDAAEFGTVEHDGQTLALTQIAYCSNHPDVATYEARAIGIDGVEYLVTWDCVEGWMDLEDESECCDWSQYAVRAL